MYTTPRENSGINRESWFLGCTPLLERTVGSVQRVAFWDVHHSWRGQWLGSESRSPRIRDVHHSWRGQWAQFGVALWDVHHSWRRQWDQQGELVLGMYTTPGEDSGLSSESRSPGCTPLLEKTVGSTRRVGSGDVHHSWRGQWAQFGESLSGMYTTPGGDSGIIRENLWNTHQSWRRLGSTRTVSFEDTHHSWWRFSFGINTAYIAGASHIFTKTQQQQ